MLSDLFLLYLFLWCYSNHSQVVIPEFYTLSPCIINLLDEWMVGSRDGPDIRHFVCTRCPTGYQYTAFPNIQPNIKFIIRPFRISGWISISVYGLSGYPAEYQVQYTAFPNIRPDIKFRPDIRQDIRYWDGYLTRSQVSRRVFDKLSGIRLDI